MDTIQQAAGAVEGDVAAVQTADATSGTVAAAVVGATEVGGVAAQVIDAAAQGATEAADAAPGIEAEAKNMTDSVYSRADTLFSKVKEEIEGLVGLAGSDWHLLKEAIVKHL